MKNQITFKLGLIAAAVASVFGSAYAADEADAMRQLTKPDSSVSIGLDYLDHDRQQLGKYDGLDKSGPYLGLGAEVNKRDETTGTWLNVTAKNVGLDSRELGIGYQQQGNWGVTVDYSRTPSRNPNTYFTGLQGIGTTTMTYGTVGQAATSAAATTAASNGLFPATQEVHLGTKRDATSLSLYKFLTPSLSFNVNFKNEDKTGTRHWGRGSNYEFVVEPIDSVTRQLEALINFAEDRLQLSAGVYATWYKNQNSYVDTVGGSQTNVTNANGFSRTNGHTFLSLPLDNESYQVFVNGGYNFTNTTRGTFKAAYTKAIQNDSLNAMTNGILASGALYTNGVVNPAAVPSSLDGRVDTTLFELGLSTKPMDKLSVVGNLRYQERDDKTPHRSYADYWTFRCSGAGTTSFASATQPVTGAACPAVAAGIGTVNAANQSQVEVENNPRDFKNLAAKVEANYRLNGYGLTAGINFDRRERQYETDPATGQYVRPVKIRGRNDETTLNLQVRRSLGASLGGTVGYQYSKRDGSTWLPASGLASEPLPINFVNPTPFADRKRDKLRFMVDWTPIEAATLQFNVEGTKDTYESGRAGIKDGSTLLLSVDGSYAINDTWKLNGWASRDVSKTHQVGYTYDSRQTASPNWHCTSVLAAAVTGGCRTDLVWDGHFKDTGNSIGIGLRGALSTKFSVGADFQFTETKSAYPIDSNVPTLVTATAVSRQGLPEIRNTMTKLGLFGQYALEKNSDVRVDLIHERWRSNDWTSMEWNAGGTALMPVTYMDGTRVVANQDQKSNFIGARYIYKFQ